MNVVAVGEALAGVNATLNATSAALLFAGYRFVKARRLEAHERCMKLAFLSSTVFLVSYLTRVALTGSHAFPGGGLLKVTYLAILLSHMALAMATVPLALRTLFLGHRKRFADHRKIARYAFPIWMYVSVTGVLVYVLLYHVARL
jgi:putative membrane protein